MRKALVLQTPEIRRRNLFSRWAQISQPTLAIWGRDDHVVPLSAGQQIAAAVPGARLVVLDDSGHWPQFEQPDDFNDAVLSFLAEGPASEPAGPGAPDAGRAGRPAR